ncbi:copper amine oxidase N-terminal domain-containing protein [Desulfallas sp. Bu1-1]|nr:copper amine oxidase N-terminal domain-containing protein [Desulfallas sp. Bu1-1]
MFFSCILFLAMLTINLPFITAGASAQEQERVEVYDQQKNLVKSVVFVLGLDQYFVNGQTPGTKMDAKPFIESGRTFVPVRYLSNALGVTDEHIGWKSPRVTLDAPGFPAVELSVSSKQLKSNGKATTMDVSPLARQGRTYLPARWVAEALGYTVDWDPKLPNVVLCYPKGAEKPDISTVLSYIGQVPATGSIDEIFKNAKPFAGVPLDKSKYNTGGVVDGFPRNFDVPGVKIQEVTVADLKPNGIKLGSDTVVLDMNVTKDKVYIKYAQKDVGALSPLPIILAEGNMVARGRANPLTEYNINPFTHGYNVYYDGADRGLSPADITKISHIMILAYDQILAIKNPMYGGAK